MAEQSMDFKYWLQYNRRKRELTYQILQGFQKIQGLFSYLRLQGITRLLTVLLRLSKQDLGVLQLIQNNPETNVARFLINNILAPINPPEISPITDQEIQRALDVLQGVCLMHPGSKKVLRQLNGIEILVRFLDSPHPPIQASALDAILSACLDSRANQQLFVKNDGFDKVVGLLARTTHPKELRIRCAEFLCLVGYYLDEVAQDEGIVDYGHAEDISGELKNSLRRVMGTEAADKLATTVQFDFRQPPSGESAFLTWFDQTHPAASAAIKSAAAGNQ